MSNRRWGVRISTETAPWDRCDKIVKPRSDPRDEFFIDLILEGAVGLPSRRSPPEDDDMQSVALLPITTNKVHRDI